jgi:hypothetical protein
MPRTRFGGLPEVPERSVVDRFIQRVRPAIRALRVPVLRARGRAIDRKHGARRGLTLTLGEAAHLCANPVKEAVRTWID